MNNILNTIHNSFEDNLEVMSFLILLVLLFYTINIILGTIIGTKEDGFNFKKFLSGFFKMLVVCLCAFGFCIGLNLFQLVLALIDFNISSEVLTTLEVIGVFITWCLDMAKEIYEKFKTFKELKYVSYDDVQINKDYYSDGGLG